MTMNDAFDQRLKAAFAEAAEPLNETAEADRFAQRVVTQLSHPDRKRALMLGGAGSIGSALAGTQLEGVFNHVQVPTDGLLANFAFLMSPETLAALAMAITIGMVALILPRRIA
jgi:hypothetical protein